MGGGASSVMVVASAPIRVYLNSAISARGSRSSAWNCASLGAASSAAAQALQRLEGAVGGAAQPRVEGLGLVEPHQGLLGGAGQQCLSGEIGGVGVAGDAVRHFSEHGGRLGIASRMEPQQAQRVPGPRADGGVADQRGQQTLGLGVVGRRPGD